MMRTQTDVLAMESVVSGEGQPLVLVPGGLTGWLSWIPHAERLSASRQVIRVQLRSVGLGLAGTPLPPGYSIDYEAEALRRTLDDLGVEKADFAGWSYGGLTTLTFALAYPERVRSLTLIEPPAFRILRSHGPFSQVMREERALFQRIAKDEVSEEDLVDFVQAVGLLPEGVDPRTLSQWPVWKKHRQSLRNANFPYEHEIDLDRVRALAKPALLVKGEGSTASLHAIIDVLAEALPEAQVVCFPGGHAPHIVSMQPFLETFRRFLLETEEADGRA